MKLNILVTGAAGQLGSVVVEYLLSKGHRVFGMVSNGKKPLGYSNPMLSYYEADLSDEAQTSQAISAMLSAHQKIDAAFLLAGGFAMGTLENTPLSDVKKLLAMNFDTAYPVVRALFAPMKNNGGGKIVFVGARPGLEMELGPPMIGYALSKSLIFSFAAMLNAQSRESGIQCSVLVPGTIDTQANRHAMPTADFSTWVKPETLAKAFENIALSNNTPTQTVIPFY